MPRVRQILSVLGILRLWQEVIELVRLPIDLAGDRVDIGDRVIDRLSAYPARRVISLALLEELLPEFLEAA